MTQKALLDRLEIEVRDMLEQARHQIAPLPSDALLFRPGPSNPKEKPRWNILECLAHLNAFSDDYFAHIELSIHKAKARQWLSAPDAEVRYFGRGKRAIRRADPNNGKRYKATKRYNFAGREFAPEVVKIFIINSERLLRLLQLSREIDLNRARIRKAHAWTAKYSLGNLLEFLVVHQRRHLNQAQVLREKAGF